MRHVIVRYKVKPNQAEQNEALIHAVYNELERAQPRGIRYATFKLKDGVSFLHLATIETEDGHSPLTDVAAFTEFQAGIRDRCEEPPAVTELDQIGSYRLFAGE